MTEKELNQLGLLEEFSITELEQRLEFEAWCNWNCGCGPSDGNCPCESQPPDSECTNIDCPCEIQFE